MKMIKLILLLKHNIIIGSPGTSTWERACMGIPNIVIPVAENQIEISEILKNKDITIINSTHNKDDFDYDHHLSIRYSGEKRLVEYV